MSNHAHTHAHDHSADWKIYAGILAALLVLTIVTVAASRFDFGSANVVIAILIATVKASLVALFFMHLRHDSPVNAIVFLSALLFLAFLLILCIIDINSRYKPTPYNWKGPEPGLISPAQLEKGTVPGAAPAAAGGAPAAPASTPAPAKH
jgi:cytochrome c oxidase subunit 4